MRKEGVGEVEREDALVERGGRGECGGDEEVVARALDEVLSVGLGGAEGL